MRVLSDIWSHAISKEALLVMIDSDLFGISILAIVLILFSTIVSLFKPLKQKRTTIRYIAAILNVIALVLLLSTALVLLPEALGREKQKSILWVFGLLLIPTSLLLAYRQVRSLLGSISILKSKLLEAFHFNKMVMMQAALFFIPLAAVALARIFLLEYRFSARGLGAVWSAVFIAPVFEEFAFRFLLPRLARDDDCVFRDYILFSGIFWLLHVDVTSLGPFFISLYLYFVLRKTGNLTVTILFHAFWNFCFFAFSALPVS